MTLPSIGTTPGAQAANESISATSDANGNITFVGPSGLQGATTTAVVTVPSAPPNAIFTATQGTPNGEGTGLSTWGGTSTGGQFQITVGQTLVVTGSGLSPKTNYLCVFALLLDVGDAQLVLPTPQSSAALAVLAGVGIEAGAITAATTTVASGATGPFPAFSGPYRLWSLGYSCAASVSPTVGTVLFEIGVGTGTLFDSLNVYECASSRLAGVKSPGNPLVIVNKTDVTITAFVNYSPA